MLLLIALSGCGAEPGGPARGRSVTIGLAVQEGCVSAISAATLAVGPEGSAQEFEASIGSGQAALVFPGIEVEQGQVLFAVSVISDNGTELYGKDTTVNIDESTFDVDLTLEKRNAVLEVCPGNLALDRGNNFQDTLEIINRGIGTLAYEAVSPDCSGEPCLSFNPPTGSAAAGVVGRVVDSLIRMAPAGSVEMRVQSPVGSVPIIVTLPQLPDVVVDAFTTTGDLIYNPDFTRFELPINVTFRNDGNTPAGIFKITAEYTDESSETFVAQFQVGAAPAFYPFTEAPLAGGGTVTLAGSVYWPDFVGGQDVELRIEGDTCSGDEFIPPYCRVDEFNEANNFSQDITVSIPPPPPPPIP
jgi:hypothetical protein